MTEISTSLKFLLHILKFLGLLPFEFKGERKDFEFKLTKFSITLFIFVFLIILLQNIYFHILSTLYILHVYTPVSFGVIMMVNLVSVLSYVIPVISLICKRKEFTSIVRQFLILSDINLYIYKSERMYVCMCVCSL